jgi:hypothetical protein
MNKQVRQIMKIDFIKAPSDNTRETHGPKLLIVRVSGTMENFKNGDLLKFAQSEAENHYSRVKLFEQSGGQFDDDAYELYTAWMDWS